MVGYISHWSINPLNPKLHFWLHTALFVLARGFCISRKEGQGELGGVTCRVVCSWQLLGLAVKRPWLAPGGPILMKTLPCRGLISDKEGCWVLN